MPQAFGDLHGVQTAVTGVTAEDIDFTDQMKHGAPYVIAFVLAFAFLLLLVAFRSIVVPLKAVVLNLLSVGASYGILALVFEHRWAEPILGFRSNGAIISWLPIFLFVVLFGLSMDYHVFILSRIREAVDGGMSTDAAVRHGITVTAGVVTSAALVMVAVFSLFGTLSSLEIKQAGVGLAAAVLIDATVIRAVLLPATMTLLGDWNWYLPRWLQWLAAGVEGAAGAGSRLSGRYDGRLARLEQRLQPGEDVHPAGARDARRGLRRAFEPVVDDREQRTPSSCGSISHVTRLGSSCGQLLVVARAPLVHEPARRVDSSTGLVDPLLAVGPSAGGASGATSIAGAVEVPPGELGLRDRLPDRLGGRLDEHLVDLRVVAVMVVILSPPARS